MADRNTEAPDTTTTTAKTATAPRPQPAPGARTRRPGRNRKTTPLATSFKQYVDNAPEEDVKDLSVQLRNALGSIANGGPGGGGGGDITASCVGRVEQHYNNNDNDATRTTFTNDFDGAASSSAASPRTTRLLPPSLSNSSNVQRSTSYNSLLSASISSASKQHRPSSGNNHDEYYAPKSSSRRNSKAGEELAQSMKMSAQRMLAELGEISDDEGEDLIRLDDDDGSSGSGISIVGGVERLKLDGLREESVRGIMREDSGYSPHHV